jgi:hypothetical protein
MYEEYNPYMAIHIDLPFEISYIITIYLIYRCKKKNYLPPISQTKLSKKISPKKLN